MPTNPNSLAQLEADLDALPIEATAAFKEKRYDDYLVSAEKILRENPDNRAALLYYGMCMKEKEEYEEAAECFQRVIELCPLFFHTYFYKGECLLMDEQYDEALDAFKEYTRFTRKQALGWCYSALTFFMKGKEAMSIALLENVYNEVEDKEKILFLKGMLEERSGDPDDALISYMQSQILAKDEKELSAERIYRLLNK